MYINPCIRNDPPKTAIWCHINEELVKVVVVITTRYGWITRWLEVGILESPLETTLNENQQKRKMLAPTEAIAGVL